MQWGGDYWGSPAHEGLHAKAMKVEVQDERRLLSEERVLPTSTPLTSRIDTVVKMKIRKKQLEELLRKIDVHGLSVQQVLSQLMSVGDHHRLHHRSWRPALQSVPEINLADRKG